MNEQLIHMQQIFQEREEQYKERDAEFKARLEQLQLLGEQLLQERNYLSQKEKELNELKAYVDQDVANIKIEQQLELEQIKNERVKLDREKESLMYESILKHLTQDSRLNITKEEWSETGEERVTEQFSKLNLPEEVWGEISEEISEDENNLTPDTLLEHLQSNQGFSEIECRQEEVGKVVRATRKDLQYRFVFSSPPCFLIFALRKNSRGLRKAFAELGKQYPHIQFTYQEDRAVAQVFFKESATVQRLMQEVDKISGHFAEESG